MEKKIISSEGLVHFFSSRLGGKEQSHYRQYLKLNLGEEVLDLEYWKKRRRHEKGGDNFNYWFYIFYYRGSG